MTTIRVATRTRFTQVTKASVNDSRLSFRARGVLVWLLDKPDDWRVNADAIARQSTEGRDAIRTALRELERAGYLVRSKVQEASGKWATEVVVYESPPVDKSDSPGTDSQSSVPPAVLYQKPWSHRGLENRRPVNRPSDSQALNAFDTETDNQYSESATHEVQTKIPPAVIASGLANVSSLRERIGLPKVKGAEREEA